jgi:murein DD-endopeptidase MepM/ murein hydrolase activator NlpD
MSDIPILDPELSARLEKVEQHIEKFGDKLTEVEKGLAEVKVEVRSLHEELLGGGGLRAEVTGLVRDLAELRGSRDARQKWVPPLAVGMATTILGLGIGVFLNNHLNRLDASIGELGKTTSILQQKVAVLEFQAFKLIAMPLDPNLRFEITASGSNKNAVNFVVKDGPKEARVMAMSEGTVTDTKPAIEGGRTFWTVVVKPDVGFAAHYAHLAAASVTPGQRVNVGQEIGLVRAGSPVCLQVWLTKPQSDEAIDPRPFLPNRK